MFKQRLLVEKYFSHSILGCFQSTQNGRRPTAAYLDTLRRVHKFGARAAHRRAAERRRRVVDAAADRGFEEHLVVVGRTRVETRAAGAKIAKVEVDGLAAARVFDLNMAEG